MGNKTACFFDRLSALMHNALLWNVMPPRSLTVATRALAFRVVSRMGCSFRQLVSTAHEHLPQQLFLLLLDPVKWAPVLEKKTRMHVGWVVSVFESKVWFLFQSRTIVGTGRCGAASVDEYSPCRESTRQRSEDSACSVVANSFTKPGRHFGPVGVHADSQTKAP